MAMTHTEWLRTIQAKEGEFVKLNKRMDGDEDLRRMKDYKLQDTQNRDMKRVVSMTMNGAATFADKIISAMNNAERQSVAESETGMSETKLKKIEDGVELILATADRSIQKQGMPGLFPAANDQVCIRGRVNGRWLLNERDDGLVPDIMMMDTRQCTYEFDTDGLAWHQFWINKTKAQIKKTYGINYRGDNGRLRELWTPEESFYWLDDQPLTKNDDFKDIGGKHNYGEVPVVVQITPVGSPIQGKDSEQYRGESIYWLVRKLYKELDRAISILQTQNLTSLRPPRQYLSDDPTQVELPDESPYEMDTTVAVERLGGYKEMPRLDMIAASRFVYSIIETHLQRGSLSALDYGNITFPLSAVAIKKVKSEKDTIFVPRIHSISLFYQMGFLMLMRMLEKQGGRLALGTGTTKRYFDKSDFEGDYEVGFKWRTIDPEENIANYSLAAAARGEVSHKTRLRDIIQVDNPDEEYNLVQAEAATRESPLLRLYTQIKALIELGREDEAEFLAQTELRMTAQQVMSGGLVDKKLPSEDKPEGLIDLLGRAGAGGGRSQSGREALEMSTTIAREA